MENTVRQLNAIYDEVNKVIVGKEAVVAKVLMAILADGHVLLDDVPGVGKTTLAVAFSKALGLKYTRIQFTPDVLPSDIVGFSMYQQQTGTFVYMPGAVTDANIVLADEINRTSSRTQSALLEAMEERQVTVDGTIHPLRTPFLVIATQNQVGTAGTQLLPQAQLDRFLMRLTIGYPDFESEKNMLRDRHTANPLDSVKQVTTEAEILRLQKMTTEVLMKESILTYITQLTTKTRDHELIQLGVSPRGALAVCRMAKACALVSGGDYVLPEDVQVIFSDVCAHRILLTQKAKSERTNEREVLNKLMKTVPVPTAPK
jgi:MoxR-like ATPase